MLSAKVKMILPANAKELSEKLFLKCEEHLNNLRIFLRTKEPFVQ